VRLSLHQRWCFIVECDGLVQFVTDFRPRLSCVGDSLLHRFHSAHEDERENERRTDPELKDHASSTAQVAMPSRAEACQITSGELLKSATASLYLELDLQHERH
jgi:hypothetical protein